MLTLWFVWISYLTIWNCTLMTIYIITTRDGHEPKIIMTLNSLWKTPSCGLWTKARTHPYPWLSYDRPYGFQRFMGSMVKSREGKGCAHQLLGQYRWKPFQQSLLLHLQFPREATASRMEEVKISDLSHTHHLMNLTKQTSLVNREDHEGSWFAWPHKPRIGTIFCI